MRIPILDLSPEIDVLWPELQAAFERVMRSGEQHPPFNTVRRLRQPDVANFDYVFGATQRQIGFSELEERGGRIPAHRVDQLFHLLRGRSSI